MPALYPVIGFDPWDSEPERAVRAARRARIWFAIRTIARNFVEGIFLGLVIAGVAALILRIFGFLPR